MLDRIINRKDSNKFLNHILGEIKDFTEDKIEHIENLTDIGIALSAERDLDKLLSAILTQAKKFTNADAGTMYLKSQDGKFLNFKIVQTDSLNISMGCKDNKITWAPLSLYDKNNNENRDMVAVLCALDGKIINLQDVYEVDGFNFEGTKIFDKKTGYRSKSMLVIPLKNYENEVIGCFQLINKIDKDTKESIKFTKKDEYDVYSLASQAAVSITNTKLMDDLEDLLISIIKVIANAIDLKSKYTGGHIKRVAEISSLLANKMNEVDSGKYKDINFSKEQLKEIDISAWMHDIGKITTPEYIIDKATKLEGIFDRISLIQHKFEILKRDKEIEFLKINIELMWKGDLDKLPTYEKAYKDTIESLNNQLSFLEKINIGGEFLNDEKIDKLNLISKIKYKLKDETIDLLTKNELENLSIKKGTITETERKKINEHAKIGYDLLSTLKFPKYLSKVPEIASGHHEQPCGKGYPNGLKDDEISIEMRILTIADIFEALTAGDRPYKKGKTLSEATKILGFMAKDRQIDGDLLKFFYETGLYKDYAKRNLQENQLDFDNIKINF